MNHHPRKRFGQNFLHDAHVIDAIVKAIHPMPHDNVLEIGPGLGALTQPLLQVLDHLNAVEIDRDLQEHLKRLPIAQDKFHLIGGDALKVDYSQFGSHLRIVGNLPYNISTPLLLRLLEYAPFIKDMYFMLQKEVVMRMAASHGTKAYGRLSVMMQYECEVVHVFDVPPEAFDPPPKVNSAIVRLIPYKQSPFEAVDRKVLEQVVARAFSMRRKTLRNNLKGLVSTEELNQLGIIDSKRPEDISISEYVHLAKFISR